MCGRFTLQTPMSLMVEMFGGLQRFGSVSWPPNQPRYNIAPTQMSFCVRPGTSGEDLEAVNLRWGLVPSWSKDLKMGARMINARGETVAEKPSFRSAFKRKRCVVLADGFYEWQKVSDGKQPFYISRPDSEPFALAGLWESWRDKADPAAQSIETFTIITTSANKFMSGLHDRMPVVLEGENQRFWLDSDFEDREKLESFLKPCPDDYFRKFPVSRVVNKASNESLECIQEIKL